MACLMGGLPEKDPLGRSGWQELAGSAAPPPLQQLAICKCKCLPRFLLRRSCLCSGCRPSCAAARTTPHASRLQRGTRCWEVGLLVRATDVGRPG